MQRAFEILARFLCVLDDMFENAVHEGMFQAPGHRRLAPFGVFLLGLALLALEALGDLDQALGRVLAAVEDDILDALPEFRFDLVINVELAGIHDAHIHARRDGVIEEDRVHRPAHRLVSAKTERDVREPAGDVTAGAGRADLAGSMDEIQRIGIVLLDPGRDGEDIRIEDDILGRKTHLLSQDAIGTLADLDLA